MSSGTYHIRQCFKKLELAVKFLFNKFIYWRYCNKTFFFRIESHFLVCLNSIFFNSSIDKIRVEEKYIFELLKMIFGTLFNRYCSKYRKISMSCHHLDLGPAMSNIEFIRDIFIYYNVFQFHVPRSITFSVIKQKHRNTHTDSDEYFIVAFCKNATIIMRLSPVVKVNHNYVFSQRAFLVFCHCCCYIYDRTVSVGQ